MRYKLCVIVVILLLQQGSGYGITGNEPTAKAVCTSLPLDARELPMIDDSALARLCIASGAK